jgi:hypothetical protein
MKARLKSLKHYRRSAILDNFTVERYNEKHTTTLQYNVNINIAAGDIFKQQLIYNCAVNTYIKLG